MTQQDNITSVTTENSENTKPDFKKPLISENVSKRITALRFLLIALVVFAHNNKTYLFMTDWENFSVFSTTFAGHILQVLNYTFLGQGAVPLFFLFSAYLLAKKLDPYPVMMKKKAKALLAPYLLWPAVTIGFLILVKLAAILIFPDKVNHSLPYISDWTVEDWICAFIGKYPAHYNNSLFEPYVGPFYYVRDLIMLSALSPVIIKLIKKCSVPYFLVVLCLFSFTRPVLFTWSGLLFFSLGILFGLKDYDFFAFTDKIKWRYLIPAAIIVWFISTEYAKEVTFYEVLCAAIVLLKFSQIIVDKCFDISKYLASFSFFLYAFHEPKFLNFIVKIWYKIIPARNIFTDTIEFIFVGTFACAIITLIAILFKKIAPKIFVLFNGGR